VVVTDQLFRGSRISDLHGQRRQRRSFVLPGSSMIVAVTRTVAAYRIVLRPAPGERPPVERFRGNTETMRAAARFVQQ